MNKEILRDNLIKTINKIDDQIDFKSSNIKFNILPILEEVKIRTSLDDWMYLGGFKNIMNDNILLDLEDVIDIIITPDGKIPVWINVKLEKMNKEIVIFKLAISMRFRKAKGLDVENYDFVPFKINQKLNKK